MSVTNEDDDPRWELGDSITVHLDPEEPDPAADAVGGEDDAAGEAGGDA